LAYLGIVRIRMEAPLVFRKGTIHICMYMFLIVSDRYDNIDAIHNQNRYLGYLSLLSCVIGTVFMHGPV
jgi:hypothetical protein